MAKATIVGFENKRTIRVGPICKNIKSTVLSELPFKIKITRITVPGYGSGNPAPLGLAIIGFNNYIL